MQLNSEHWTAVKNTSLGGSSVSARKSFDKQNEQSGHISADVSSHGIPVGISASPQFSQKQKGDSKWLLNKAAVTKSKTDAHIPEETPSFADLLSSTLIVKTQGLISAPIDKWAEAAEVDSKHDDLKAKSSHTPTSSLSPTFASHNNPKLNDLSYVSEDDDEDDDNESEGDWEQVHSPSNAIVLVVNADGSFGPSLKSDVVQAARKEKEKLELEQNQHQPQHKPVGKRGGSRSQSPVGSESGKILEEGPKKDRGQNSVSKQHQHKNLAQASGAVVMSNYAKKAFTSTVNVPYVTRASRLHLAADKIVIKVLQG